METFVPVTKEIFSAHMEGRGNMLEFVDPEEIVYDAIPSIVSKIEKEYGIDANQRVIGLVTTPLSDMDKLRIRNAMRNRGYLAFISNEEMQCGPHYIEYCEIIINRCGKLAASVG